MGLHASKERSKGKGTVVLGHAGHPSMLPLCSLTTTSRTYSKEGVPGVLQYPALCNSVRHLILQREEKLSAIYPPLFLENQRFFMAANYSQKKKQGWELEAPTSAPFLSPQGEGFVGWIVRRRTWPRCIPRERRVSVTHGVTQLCVTTHTWGFKIRIIPGIPQHLEHSRSWPLLGSLEARFESPPNIWGFGLHDL